MFTQVTNPYVTAMKREHRELGEMVHDLQLVLARADAEGWPTPLADELVNRLRLLETCLAEHFAREEEGGLLEEAAAAAPRFCHDVDQLLVEHPQMLARLRVLTKVAVEHRNRAQPMWQAYAAELGDLLAQFLTHEARENTLLQKAFNVCEN